MKYWSKDFPSRLQQAVDAREMSHNKVRTALQQCDVQGRAPLSYQHYKNGKVSPSLETCEALSNILNVDTCWLAFGKGEM